MTSKTELKALTLLRSAPLTADMDMKQLKKLAALAREVEFSTSEIIYRKGELGEDLYLIEHGEVVIETEVIGQGYVSVNWLGPGDFFGWSSLFPPERKMSQTRAVRPTQAIAFQAEALRLAMQADHNLEYAITRRAGKAMTDRIKDIRRQLTDLMAPLDIKK